MLDTFGRKIEYLRISVTDRCNLRCTYCMPGDIDLMPMSEVLTYEEIARIAELSAQLGIRHLRLTGGEPLVRKHCEALAAMLTKIPGIESVGLTTNGVLLAEKAVPLLEAGISGVNVSLDTLDPEQFRRTTGFDLLDRVLKGIDTALDAGLPVKFNAVARNCTDEIALAEFASDRDVSIRYIELMPIGKGAAAEGKNNGRIREHLAAAFGAPEPAEQLGFGPAVYYKYPGLRQPVGFISAIHGKFCSTCNRIRLTSDGFLKLCLCYSDGADLKVPIRSGISDDELKKIISEAVLKKPAAHSFEDMLKITETMTMNRIGG